MKRLLCLGLLASISALACGETPPKVQLRSLQASGDVTAVCRSAAGEGLPLASCPDYEFGQNSLLALVTQTLTDEVALIELTRGAFVDLEDGRVLDVDPSMPGFNFMRLPGRPGGIVTSPGGAASFVAVTGIGREGLVGLPTSCMSAPRAADGDVPAEERRDLTSLPACSLPSAPGSIAIVIDRPGDDGTIAASCDRSLGAEEAGSSAGATRSVCAADLTSELGPEGRRKLVVALPDDGQIAVIDAQSLLDREPGSYAPCDIELWAPLGVDLPASPVEPRLPPDLQSASCQVGDVVDLPDPATFSVRPTGFALADDGRLYVGDSAAPVVHVLDAQNPCVMSELSPLLPQSFENGERLVTTSRLAVSPLTPQGKRFLYAIDQHDQPGASVMIFDVSPGSTERTPIVRPGTPRLPLEPADRIGFSSAAVDVGFVLRDLPANDVQTGIATTGLSCDPDPGVDALAPAAQYRPSGDLTSGARPALLRGVFGFVMLSSGQVVVIDAEDFDATCRRPVTTNPGSEPDFRGCVNDEGLPELLTSGGEVDGTPLVTDEVSCTVVEPHRARAAQLAINDARVGVRAPTLRAFPQFSTPDPSAQTDVLDRAKLLAVPFETGEAPIVYVGSDLYTTDEASTNELHIDPLAAEQNSVTLPLAQPRAYASEEAFSLTFEGPITGTLPSGFLDLDGARTTLSDGSANFCDRGVYGVNLMREYGAEHFAELSEDELDAFARKHADYVQINANFPDDEEEYWASERGIACGGRVACEALFGPYDARDLASSRELVVLDAWQGELLLEPRNAENDAQRQELSAMIDCCFPSGLSYTVRASQQWVLAGSISGFRHDVHAEETEEEDGTPRFHCERDCDPRKRYFNHRVFELARSEESCGDLLPTECPVGLAESGDLVCRFDVAEGPVTSSGQGSECIVNSLNARFALYRGRAPSIRGMTFTWTTAGGFIPLAMSLTPQSPSVLPQSMLYLPELQHLAVVDASSLGLTLFSLDSLLMEAAFY
jgi:hypothetical protein